MSAQLAKLWKDNSATKIVEVFASQRLYVTRNAIIGRAHRMGLTAKALGRRTEKESDKPQREIKRNKSGIGAVVQRINRRADAPKLKAERFIPRAAEIVSRRKPLLDLLAMECRWADDERNEDGFHTFCGHPTADGHSYCPTHRYLAVDQARMTKIRAARGISERAAA